VAAPFVRICEHLPEDGGGLLDRFTSSAPWTPCEKATTGSQHGLPDRQPGSGTRGPTPRPGSYPAIGSVCAKFRGPNHHRDARLRGLPLARDTHLAFAGYLGRRYDPFIGN